MARTISDNQENRTPFGKNQNLSPHEARKEQAMEAYLKQSHPLIVKDNASKKHNYKTQQALVLSKVVDILEEPTRYDMSSGGDDQIPTTLMHGSSY